jgi:hypothetical protein
MFGGRLGGGAAALIDGGTGPTPRIRVLRRGEGAGGESPARWDSLGPTSPGSRIDFVRYQIPPSTVLGPAAASVALLTVYMIGLTFLEFYGPVPPTPRIFS